jgi:hypothetical protein
MTIATGSSRIELPLRGSGKVGVRMRARDGAWWYYGPPDFRPKRSMRYVNARFDAWTTAALSLTPLERCTEAEVEIRIGKGEDYRFWIGTPEAK